MAVSLHEDGLAYARWLIEQGRVVRDGREDWPEHRPMSQDENEFIAGRSMEEFGRWHLAVDSDQGEGTKGWYKFPFGDLHDVHRCAILTVAARAGQYKYLEIERAAAQLHGLLERIRARD